MLASALTRSVSILLLSSFICVAGSVRIDPLPVSGNPSDQNYLQYDDGSAQWLTWAGVYRGVWFNTEDFVGFAWDPELIFSEYWMYHHSSSPWDISEFYAEIWNGSSAGPDYFIDQTEVTALHYSPAFVYYPQGVFAKYSFWAIENTEMSAGGWPSILGDGSPPAVHHSFYSDDFTLWEPWSDGTSTGDYFIRIECYLTALTRTSWGSIKTLF